MDMCIADTEQNRPNSSY